LKNCCSEIYGFPVGNVPRRDLVHFTCFKLVIIHQFNFQLMRSNVLFLSTMLLVVVSCAELNYLEQQMDLVDQEATLDEAEADDPFARKGGTTSTSQNFAVNYPGWKSEYTLTASGSWSSDRVKAEADVRGDFHVVANSTRDRDLLEGQIKENQVNGKITEYLNADFCACTSDEDYSDCEYWTFELSGPNNTTTKLNVELAGLSALVSNKHSKYALDLSTLDDQGGKVPRVVEFSYSLDGGITYTPLINQGLMWSDNTDCASIEGWQYNNATEPTNPGSAAASLASSASGKTMDDILLSDNHTGNDNTCYHAEMYKGQIELNLLDLVEGNNTILIRAIVKGNEGTVDATVGFSKDIRITGNTPTCN
jgi:hypothetical protein